MIAVGTRYPREHGEGIVARTIEEQTAKLPSDTFLWLAMGLHRRVAYADKFLGRDKDALFVGRGPRRS